MVEVFTKPYKVEEIVNDYLFGVSTRQNIRGCKIFPSRSVRDSRYKLIVNYNSIEVYKSNLGNNESEMRLLKAQQNLFLISLTMSYMI